MFTYVLVGAVITILIVGMVRNGKEPHHKSKPPIEETQEISFCEDPSISIVGYVVVQHNKREQVHALTRDSI